MMKVIVVSGTPGAGKTVFAKKLAEEKDYEYIDVNRLIEEKNIFDEYDKEKKCYVVDIKILNKELVKLIQSKDVKGLVIDSHLAHNIDPKHIDECVIVKCELKELEKRLKARGYSSEKIRENLDSEIFDVCLIEAKEKGHDVRVVRN